MIEIPIGGTLIGSYTIVSSDPLSSSVSPNRHGSCFRSLDGPVARIHLFTIIL